MENGNSRRRDESAGEGWTHRAGKDGNVPASGRDVYGTHVEDKNFLSSLKTASSHKFRDGGQPGAAEPAQVTDEKLHKRLDFNTPPPSAYGTPCRAQSRAGEQSATPASGLRRTGDPFAASLRCTNHHSQATAATLRSTDLHAQSPLASTFTPRRSATRVSGYRSLAGEEDAAQPFSYVLSRAPGGGEPPSSQEIEVLQRPRLVELLKTEGYPVPQYVDVVRDVFVDMPVERLIERPVLEDVFVERLVERVVEVPVEQLIEHTVERVVERPVERRRVVERAVERCVEVPYDVFTENIIVQERVIDVREEDLHCFPDAERLPTEVWLQRADRYEEVPVLVENIIEQEVLVPRQRFVEVPVERVTEVRVPVVIERDVPCETVVVREVSVPVENVVYRRVPVNVERAVYRENIVELPMPYEVLVEKEVLVPVERLVSREVPVERVVPREVDVPVEVPVGVEEMHEVPVEYICQTEIPVEEVTPVAREKIIRRSSTRVHTQQTPVERAREVLVPVHVETLIPRVVQRVTEKRVERVVEKPVYIERVVERPREVERVVELRVEHVVERPRVVERVVERAVVYDTIIEKEVEVIVVRDVEVPVTKVVEVEVRVFVERPVFREVEIVEEYDVETECNVYDVVEEDGGSCEVEDPQFAHLIEQRHRELAEDEDDHNGLLAARAALKEELGALQRFLFSAEAEENVELLVRHANISSELICKQRNLEDACHAQRNRLPGRETRFQRDPRVESLRAELFALIDDNRRLISEIRLKAYS